MVACAVWLALALAPYCPPLAPHRWPNPYRLWCITLAAAAEATLFLIAARRTMLGRRLQQANAMFGVALLLVAVSDTLVILMRLPTTGRALSHVNDVLEFTYTLAGLAGLLWMPLAPLSRSGRRLVVLDIVIAVSGMVLVYFATTTMVGLSSAHPAERSRIVQYGLAGAGNLVALNLILVRGLARPVRGAIVFLAATTVLEIAYWVLVQFHLAGLRIDLRLVDVVFAADQVCYAGAALAFLTEPLETTSTRRARLPDWLRAINPLPAAAVIAVGGLLVYHVVTGRSQNVAVLTIGMVVLSLLLVARLMIAARDRADLVRLESERTQRLLADRVTALRQLAGGIAHEFNNLMAVIVGNTDLALELVPGGSPLSARLGVILQSADRAVLLTSRLLTYAGGGTAAVRAPVSVDDCLVDLQPHIREIVGDMMDVRYDLQSGGRRVMVDRGLFDRAVLNVVSNAAAAMTAHGRLHIATRETSLAGGLTDAVLPAPPGAYAVIEISDNGVGMDARTIARAFDPFYTSQSRARASGLGLSVVHGTMVAHDGGIAVQSAPNCGTVFRLFFPLATIATSQRPRLQTS